MKGGGNSLPAIMQAPRGEGVLSVWLAAPRTVLGT